MTYQSVFLKSERYYTSIKSIGNSGTGVKTILPALLIGEDGF